MRRDRQTVEGEEAVRQWIGEHQKRRNGLQAIFAARREVQPIERVELDRIIDIWVDAALRLEERDLKMINRIVRSQSRRMEANGGNVTEIMRATA